MAPHGGRVGRPRKVDAPLKASGRPVVVLALKRNWRLWAKLPNDAMVLLVLGAPDRERTPGSEAVIAAIPRPKFPKGVCQKCGCTYADPCVDDFGQGCRWVDADETLCSACEA